jgi:hypothetical protein
MRKDILERKAEILEWIEQKQSKAFIARQLNCKADTLNSYLTKMGINYSGNPGSKGIKTDPSYKPAIYYIINEKEITSSKLRVKLLRDGLKEAKCEVCGIIKWNGIPAPLELDHIDGDHYNNSLDNLRIVCPNCHAQTPTNAGKNRKKKTKPE